MNISNTKKFAHNYTFLINGLTLNTKFTQSSGLERRAPERAASRLSSDRAVLSLSCITLENNEKFRRQSGHEKLSARASGGGGGIRTHGGLSPTSVFKTGALNRSATPPTARAYAGICDSERGLRRFPRRGDCCPFNLGKLRISYSQCDA